MAHNLFDKRFYYRNPEDKPWHELGKHSCGLARTARQVWESLPPYEVAEMPILVKTPDGKVFDSHAHKAIVRKPTTGDFMHRVFAVVGKDYELVGPDDVVDIWDSAFPSGGVETLGALGHGETLFITTKLPEIGVAGDELEMYLLVDSPMGTGGALSVTVTPQRVVCQNTLIMARRVARSTFKLRHNQGVKQAFTAVLQVVVQDANQKAETARQFFELMAATRVSDSLADDLFQSVYYNRLPYPLSADFTSPERYELACAQYAQVEQQMGQRREAARELFQGGLTGYSAAARGTAWGAYNAVTEVENFRRYRNEKTRARGVLFGDRGRTMERAFAGALTISKGGELPPRLDRVGLREAFGAFTADES